MIRRARWMAALLAAIAMVASACGQAPQGSMKELQRTKAGDLEVVLLGPSDALERKGFAILEFHDSRGNLVNVGAVKVNATMPMAGMSPMIGGSEVKPTPAPGRYEIATDFSMAGTWNLAVEWDGPKGRGSARLPGTVR